MWCFLLARHFLHFFFSVFYKRRGLVYAEHLTTMVFFNAFLMVLTSVVFAPLIYFTRHTNLYGLWFGLMLISHVVYVAVGYKQLFNLAGFSNSAKAFGYALLATFCWMIFSLLIGFSFIIWG